MNFVTRNRRSDRFVAADRWSEWNLFCWCETASWAPLLSGRPLDVNNSEETISVLKSVYAGLKVFHACRPIEISRYYKEGLRLFSKSELDGLARERVTTANPAVSDETVARAMKQNPTDPEPLVFTVPDLRMLTKETANSFSRYGSEHVHRVASILGELDGFDYRSALERAGTPVIFEIGLPWEDVSSYVMEEFATWLPDAIVRLRSGEPVDMHEWVNAQPTPIPPEHLLGHIEVDIAPSSG